MTPEQQAELSRIRERHDDTPSWDNGWTSVESLLSIIDTLTAERDAAIREVGALGRQLGSVQAERDRYIRFFERIIQNEMELDNTYG